MNINNLHIQETSHEQTEPDQVSAYGTRKAFLMDEVLVNIIKIISHSVLKKIAKNYLTYCKLICWNLHCLRKIVLKL